MADVAIDTDVASYLQKGTEPAWVRNHIIGGRTWLTFITLGELFKWAQVRAWGEGRRARLEWWIAARAVIPYDREVAHIRGRLAGNAERRARVVPPLGKRGIRESLACFPTRL